MGQKRGNAASGILRVIEGQRGETEQELEARRRRQKFTVWDNSGLRIVSDEPTPLRRVG